ncbi:hypothetical protein INR49_022115 [Caranx melampygus]|nr:hypothetical protein INR49_022115 [Caranx melampygus]
MKQRKKKLKSRVKQQLQQLQRILARLFSRFSMSALPSSPLLPRALHSRNSTFMGSWIQIAANRAVLRAEGC